MNYLEMILLLADECVVRVGEIESFVSIDAEIRKLPASKSKLNESIETSHVFNGGKYLQFFEIAIEERMPRVLLEWLKTDALISVVKHADVGAELVAVIFIGAHHALMRIRDGCRRQFCRERETFAGDQSCC